MLCMRWPTDHTWHANRTDSAWSCSKPDGGVRDFHRSLPGYAVTDLIELPTLAVELGVGRVLAKFEADRFGLPAFKGLGASWAIQQALASPDAPADAVIVSATDGNHGRAVAHFARLAGRRAVIMIPRGVSAVAVDAIRGEGADVRVLDGDFDHAVRSAAEFAQANGGVLVQDTAWDGYEQVPGWIVGGYETLFAEIDEQLASHGIDSPDLFVVPAGVGSVTQAAVAHYRAEGRSTRTALLNVEPTLAPCVLASLATGERTTVTTSETIMAGLNCNSVSTLAWPLLQQGLDAAVAISDDDDRLAMRDLAELGIDAGSCGAACLAGARAALIGAEAEARRQHLGVDATSTVVLLVTERRLPGFVA